MCHISDETFVGNRTKTKLKTFLEIALNFIHFKNQNFMHFKNHDQCNNNVVLLFENRS